MMTSIWTLCPSSMRYSLLIYGAAHLGIFDEDRSELCAVVRRDGDRARVQGVPVDVVGDAELFRVLARCVDEIMGGTDGPI